MVSPWGLYIHDQCYLTEHLRRLFDKYLDVHAFSDNLRIRDIINCCWNLIKSDISAINFVISTKLVYPGFLSMQELCCD